MSIEWIPEPGFNIVDYRNNNDFPQSFVPPYILTFQFSKPIVFKSVRPVFLGWNTPGCGTQTLFMRIQVAKNKISNLYYDREGDADNQSTLTFTKNMELTPNDTLLVVLFPTCPAHMITISQLVFIPPPTTSKPPVPIFKPSNISVFNYSDNMYMAAVVVVLVLIVAVILFSLVRHRKYRKPI